MMQTSHAATGAVAGKFIPNPILAFLAGIIIHFVIDKIPHFWPESVKNKILFVILDHSFVYIVFVLMIIFKIGTIAIWAGIAGSLLVDIVIICIKPIFKSPIGTWHTNRQPHQTKIIYLISDVVVTVLGTLVAIYL